ncbi:uncharacterized protein JCM10292_001184 [Rhodotorula paludigena]|uniref:uncharacterized protein n=1 Tax=Rhodotorula paludigena TaxID=86838 RepID=UPI00317F6CDF
MGPSVVSITVVTSLSHLDSLTQDQARVSVIDFHAVWCGPCKAIAPVFQRLASQYGGRVQFLKVDVDAVPDVAQRFQVSAMPTFVVLKGSSKVDEMRGANPAGLMQLVSKHAPAGGAAANTSTPVEKGLEGFTVLNSQIDMSQVHCLNEADAHPFKELLRGGGDKWLESDADEQLLLQIPMQQAIKLRALRFTTLPAHAAHAPKTVKLYVNQPATDFDSTTEPAQELVLDEEQAKGLKAVELRFVRFQSVNHLSMFVVDNLGGEDVTRIDKIELIGLDIAGTKMADLQKLEDE